MGEAVITSDRTMHDMNMRMMDRLVQKLVLGQLNRLQVGRLHMIDKDQRWTFGHGGGDLEATVKVNDKRFYQALVFSGTVGVADAYIDGLWHSDNLTDVFRILVQNNTVMNGLSKGWARLAAKGQEWLHELHRNTRLGSHRNIAAHYDLGNNFYRLWLDDTMMYSCAIYDEQHQTLDDAARNKVDRICQKLDLQPGDHLLEIGTGWGGFAVYAAKHYGCRVTTTTISKEQYALAIERVKEEGLEDRVTVLLKDYRDLDGQYDKLVSIEMIEAVGHQYYNMFFKVCSDLLKPDGLMLLQAITISDWAYERAKHTVDFIKSHIFPGSCIPSVAAISNSVARVTNLRPVHLEDIGPHYVRTLYDWRTRFVAQLDAVRAQGFDDRFIRMWEYYLCYCEAGFAERYISDIQLLMAKPQNRRAPIVPREIGRISVV